VYHLAGDEHAHIVCICCQLVAQVPADVVSEVRRAFSSHGGFGLAWQHFAWTGICDACQSVRARAAGHEPAGAADREGTVTAGRPAVGYAPVAIDGATVAGRG